MSPHIQLDMERIKDFCHKWGIEEFALFSSVLRDDFEPESDIDVLVTFAPGMRMGLFDYARMEQELVEIVGRNVDIVDRTAVERSENYIRRRHILSNLERVYVAR